jgi:hypothetical protein
MKGMSQKHIPFMGTSEFHCATQRLKTLNNLFCQMTKTSQKMTKTSQNVHDKDGGLVLITKVGALTLEQTLMKHLIQI